MELTCDMERGCTQPVTHIDDKGYIYCKPHGRDRQTYRRCRQLTPKELKTLRSGQPVKRY